jgi:hypothetical protein
LVNKSILIIAPGHNENDARVNRTIIVLSQLFTHVDVLYESRFIVNRKINGLTNVKKYYVDETKPLFKIIPKLKVFKKFIIKNNLVSNYIYIHDSGILGLLIAAMIKKNFSGDRKIILDYHDFIEWEIYYQLGKINPFKKFNKFIERGLLFLLILYFKKIKKTPIDGVVGISTSQVDNFLKKFASNIQIPHIVIPNTRPKINYIFKQKKYKEIFADFLWIGNIVDGRDLKITVHYLDDLIKKFHFKFYVFGQIHSEELLSFLKKRTYFQYMGEFSADQELFNFIKDKKIISLFFGWDDKNEVGINEVASPNKVYSYLNIGTPMLLNKKINPIEFGKIYKLGCFFKGSKDFEENYIDISVNYERYRFNVYNLRERFVWEGQLTNILSNFTHNLYFDDKYKTL